MPLGHCGRCFGQAGHHHSLHWALWVQSASGSFWAGLQHGPSFLGRDSIWPCIRRKDCGQHVSVRFGKWQGNFQVEWSAVQCIHTQDFTWFCPPWWRFPMGHFGAETSRPLCLRRRQSSAGIFAPIPHHQSLWALWDKGSPHHEVFEKQKKRPCEFSWYHG